MSDLAASLQIFASAHGWGAATVSPVTGDLSPRRYYRLSRDEDTAILMDASRDIASLKPFISMTDWLRSANLTAPTILARDTDQGFLLLEDLGPETAGTRLARDPAFADIYFDACINLLLAIRETKPPVLNSPDARELAGWTTVTETGYPGADPKALSLFRSVLETELTRFLDNPTTSLRDFHAENLIWLPQREGTARLGLLDYQDAFLTHPVYDLVSLLTDARTDISRSRRNDTIKAYAARSGDDPESLATAFALFSAQRNMRILGIFANAARNGKPHHLPKLPRVHGYLSEALTHPVFSTIRDDVLGGLPDPVITAKALAP